MALTRTCKQFEDRRERCGKVSSLHLNQRGGKEDLNGFIIYRLLLLRRFQCPVCLTL